MYSENFALCLTYLDAGYMKKVSNFFLLKEVVFYTILSELLPTILHNRRCQFQFPSGLRAGSVSRSIGRPCIQQKWGHGADHSRRESSISHTGAHSEDGEGSGEEEETGRQETGGRRSGPAPE